MTRYASPCSGLLLGVLLAVGCGSGSDSSPRSANQGASGAASTIAQLDLSQALEITASQGTEWKTMLVESTSPEIFTIEVRNTSEIPLGISAALAGDDSAEFGFERELGVQRLQTGEAASVSVKYAPTSAGIKAASVQFSVWDPGDTTNRHVFATALVAEAKSWSYVGQRGFSAGSAGSYLLPSDPSVSGRVGRPGDRSMAMAADDAVLYLAYKDGTQLYDPNDTESGKVTVAKYDQGLWTTLGAAGFSDGDAMWISLAVHQHVPYVSFVEGTAATVMRFDGKAWVPVGTKRFTPSTAACAALSVSDNQGQPDLYLAFQDGAAHLEIDGTDRHGAVSVMHFDASGWSYLGAPAFTYPQMAGTSTAIVVAGGAPYVAFGSGLARYDKPTSTWTKVGSFSANSTALITNTAGELYVAFADLEHEGKSTVLSYAAGTFEALGPKGFSAGAAEFLSLGWNNENLLVAFKDNGSQGGLEGGAVASEFFGGGWSTLGAGAASPGVVSHLSLVASNGRIYLGYKDEDWPSTPAMVGTGKASVIVKK